jgi:hypothetical protein
VQRLTATVLAILPVLLAGSAGGEGVDLPLQVDYRSALVAGKDSPCIKLTAERDVRAVSVVVARRGKVHRQRVGFLGAGQSRQVCWGERPGIYAYRVGITSQVAGLAARKELTIKITLLPPIKIVLPRSKVDLEGRRLSFRLNHPADRAELTVTGRGGDVLLQTSRSYSGAMPGKALELTWGPVAGEVARLDLKVYGTGGFWTAMAISPWMVTIPHEEVQFETNRWEIRRQEAPKLDAAIREIRKALRTHGAEFVVKLYVAGFTDTVGTTSHNRTLSGNRARAIAAYLRKRGVRLPIYYRGYGEEALAVATKDETAEARNRRAVYVLASQPPVLSKHVAWGRWTPIR